MFVTIPTVGRELHLVARPVGEPAEADFALVDTPIAPPAAGQVLVQNDWFSVDPYMRPRMNDVKSYLPPFALDAPMDGGAVGTVVESNAASIPVGATILHHLGWREYATVDAEVRLGCLTRRQRPRRHTWVCSASPGSRHTSGSS